MSNSAQPSHLETALVYFKAALVPSKGMQAPSRKASELLRTKPWSAPSADRARFASLLLTSLLFGVGCTSQVDAYESEATSDSTHAVLKIQHVESVDGTSRGDAIAGFVKIPSGVDSGHVLRLAGLMPGLPPPGSCRERNDNKQWDTQSAFSDAELLEAEFVKLSSEAGTHDLAPHAFPTVADLLRGVVYTSRDRNAEALPAGTLYSWETRAIGGDEADEKVWSIDTRQMSPETPSGVLVGEIPFAEVSELEPTPVLDFAWQSANETGDQVVVELVTAELGWICSFNDSEGFGSVPLVTETGDDVVVDGTSARVSIHRFRTKTAENPGELREVKMTFDFALESQWTFRDSR